MQSLNYETYLKKLHGCYLGKAVGGTLGMPREGTLTMAEVSYYDPVPDAMVGHAPSVRLGAQGPLGHRHRSEDSGL